ncbi:hypothetical protein F511_28974 [Dorcoceras hygrometricum]|uniref:Uncharacterized protein n=1 Tax=Dorcoceras hygrometricum TaxID=472368 RepID=A0A2Z7D4P2_9LAMI|nr:hypothetical protein F511_28974 [Dorcoceras hygrometricum]
MITANEGMVRMFCSLEESGLKRYLHNTTWEEVKRQFVEFNIQDSTEQTPMDQVGPSSPVLVAAKAVGANDDVAKGVEVVEESSFVVEEENVAVQATKFAEEAVVIEQQAHEQHFCEDHQAPEATNTRVDTVEEARADSPTRPVSSSLPQQFIEDSTLANPQTQTSLEFKKLLTAITMLETSINYLKVDFQNLKQLIYRRMDDLQAYIARSQASMETRIVSQMHENQ